MGPCQKPCSGTAIHLQASHYATQDKINVRQGTQLSVKRRVAQVVCIDGYKVKEQGLNLTIKLGHYSPLTESPHKV